VQSADGRNVALKIIGDCDNIHRLAKFLKAPSYAWQEIGHGVEGVLLRAVHAHHACGCVAPSGGALPRPRQHRSRSKELKIAEAVEST